MAGDCVEVRFPVSKEDALLNTALPAGRLTHDSTAPQEIPVSPASGWGVQSLLHMRHEFLGLVDQSVVSGTRFLTTVLIGRYCGAGELGTYTLAFSLMLTSVNAQDSLVLGPFSVYGNRLKGACREAYAGSVLIQGLLLTLLSSFLLAGIAASLFLASMDLPLAKTLAVLAAVIPCILLHQFSRRFAFAELEVSTALVLDLFLALVQLTGLIGLASVDGLSAPVVYGVIGLGSLLPGLGWLWLKRRSFRCKRSDLANSLNRNWRLGRWMLAAQLTSVFSTYLTGWILAFFLGATAVGVYAACASIVCLSNPILLGLNNVFVSRSAIAFANGAQAAVRRDSRKAMLLLVGLTGLLTLVLSAYGRQLLDLLYGADYAEHYQIVTLLAVATLFTAFSLSVTPGLFAMEYSNLAFVGQFIGLLASTSASVILISYWGVIGAAWGPVVGNALTAVVTIGAHEMLTRPVTADRRSS